MKAESERLHKKFFITNKLSFNSIFSAPPGVNPLALPPLVLIILKPQCKHSIKFKRGMGELLRLMDKRTDVELKVFECNGDTTCPKYLGTKAYPEVRFYAHRENPRRFFVRMKTRSKTTSLSVYNWLNKRFAIQNARNDIIKFDMAANSKKSENDSNKRVKAKRDQVASAKSEKRLIKKMRRSGYYYFQATQINSLDFWKLMALKIISPNKDMLIFCRDRIKGLNYIIIRKIASLYPKIRFIEFRNCRKTSRHFQQFSQAFKNFTSKIYKANQKVWGEHATTFLQKTMPKVLEMISGKSKFILRFFDFSNSYSAVWTEKESKNISKFRLKFKTKKFAPIKRLNKGLMNQILSQNKAAMILFLSSDPNRNIADDERIIREFRNTSKAIRHDKKVYFTVVKGNINFFIFLKKLNN